MAVFVRVADAGTFTAAAETFGISPQMIARHIVALEKRLGAPLIHRTTRRQSLTAVGLAYYQRCRLILSEIDAAESLASDLQKTPRGILRVNAPPLYGAYNLSPCIPGYLARYPDIELDLTLSDRLVDPVEDGYEVIIRIGEPRDDSLIACPLAPFKLIACASPGYLKKRGEPKIPEDLTGHDCLPVMNAATSVPPVWLFSHGTTTFPVSVRGRLCSNDWKSLLNAAIHDAGIILGPCRALNEEIERGRLKRVLQSYDGPSRPVNVLHPANRPLSMKVQSFISFLSAEIG